MYLYVLNFVLWCYDFRMKMMFGSSLPPVVCRGIMSYLRYLGVFVHSGVHRILGCVSALFFFRLVYPMFLWIVHF
jgi:hypothetical protein